MAMYLLTVTEDDKDAYIGTTQAFFALSMIFTIWARIENGILTPGLFRYVLVGMVCSLLGKRLGTSLQAYINIGLMKRCVCGFMIVSGVSTIVGSIV